jgi:hypothetical protein
MGFNFGFRSKTQIGLEQAQIWIPTGLLHCLPRGRRNAARAAACPERGRHAELPRTLHHASTATMCPYARSKWRSTRTHSLAPPLRRARLHLHSLSLPASRSLYSRSARTDVRHGRASKARVRTNVLVDGSVVGQVELTTVPALPPSLLCLCSSRPISTGGRCRRHGHSNAADLAWPSHLKPP